MPKDRSFRLDVTPFHVPRFLGQALRRQLQELPEAIFPDQRSEEVHFPEGSESTAMTGTYHAECAMPFVSLARAIAVLERWTRF